MPSPSLPNTLLAEPSQADWCAAERFIADEYDNNPVVSRAWLATHRSNILRQAAVAEMQKRQDAEHRAKSAIENARQARKAA